MARVIYADDVQEKIVWERDLVDTDNMHGVGMHNGLSLAHAIVLTTPSVDAAPVVHGRWIEKPYLFGTTKYCSICGLNYGMPHGVFNYCPNCGAKMDLEV